jgi:leucyl aminopeptidase
MLISTHSSTVSIKGHFTGIAFNTDRDYSVLERENGTDTLSIGVEGKTPMTRRRLMTLVRTVVQEARAKRLSRIALSLEALRAVEGMDLSAVELTRLIAENAHMANYAFNVFKEKPKKGWDQLEELMLVGELDQQAKASLKLGEIVAKEVNACRDLSNTPGGDMTPTLLATRIKASAKGAAATVQVLSVKDMETLKMGAILGVARGAKEKPTFIIVEYWGGKKKDAPTVLVGKGVTFDTGGLSLKPSDYMLDMHMDMSGGAAVAHAVIAAARLKLPVNVIALIPAVENAISGESYRPGDVLRSMSGKTIDILNTDAEGRVILADALTYAKRYKPALVVDVATLTGAALVALGTKASAVLSKDDALAQKLCALGEESGDYCWQLPMWEEYKGLVKGRFGDVANIPTESGQGAGTIGGGMFLAEFADGYPWAHIDIAPRMTSDKGDHLAKGAVGAPVRMLVRLLEEESKK